MKLTEHHKVNWDFIRELEGFELKGYVPKDRDVVDRNPSGVTVVGGFDIGQHSKKQIKDLKLPKQLEDKIIPYAGITGQNARTLLKQKPLVLTEEEGKTLDTKVKEMYLEKVMKEYNDNSHIHFLTLTEQQQTVITSVAFQYGSLKNRTPNFFRSVTSGNWQKAYRQIMNFSDAYGVRRRKEAAYLGSSITIV